MDKYDGWEYQNSAPAQTENVPLPYLSDSASAETQGMPLPNLTGETDERARKRREARTHWFGKVAFILAAIMNGIIVVLFLALLIVCNTGLIKVFPNIWYFSGFCWGMSQFLTLGYIAVFFIALPGRKTKAGRRAMFAPLAAIILPTFMSFGIPWLFSIVGILVRAG